MIPENWEKKSLEHLKSYKRMLEKGNFNRMLQALPDLHEAAFGGISCLDCANCCKNYSPRFKQPDIKRIARVVGMKEGEFTEKYLRTDEDGDYVSKRTPCPFLAEDNTCNIYDDRPSDCRRYPYTDEDVMLKRIPLTLKNAVICPAAHVVLEKLLEMK